LFCSSDYFDRCQTSFAGAPSSVDIVDKLILEAITTYVKLNSYSPSVHKKHVLYFSYTRISKQELLYYFCDAGAIQWD
jgi:hypothetical protein